MNQNTSSGWRRKSRKFQCISIVSILCIFTCVCGNLWHEHKKVVRMYEATAATEMALTESYGHEVRTILEHYLFMRNINEKNLEKLSKIVAEPYLTFLDSMFNNDNTSTWHYKSFWFLDGFRVLEYTPGQIVAVGCGVVYTNEVTSDGEYITSLKPSRFRGINIFTREGQEWKLSFSYNTMDPKDATGEWEYIDDWMKELLSYETLQNHVYKDCDEF